MTHTFGRLAAVTLAATLVSTGLAGCGLLDGSSRIEEALEYLPADTTAVTFVDRAAIAERLEIDDIETGASQEDLDRWSEAAADEGYGTELSQWTAVMQDAAFSDLDVEWEATGTNETGLARIWKLSDDVDLEDVADDLEDAGYERSGPDETPVFHVDLAAADTTGLVGGRYPAVLMDIALVPDEHLVVSGAAVEDVLDTVSDDTDSLSDEGSFGDLLDQAPDEDALEYAALTLEPSCGGSGRLTPEQAAQVFEGLSYPDGGMALFADPDHDVRAVRLLGGENDPEADADGLTTYLAERAPASGLDIETDVVADGDAVLAEAAFDDRRAMVQAWTRAEGPFACPLGK